ncbi:MAG: FAD-dependent oxidoreductase [Halobacteriota archaeon]
MEIYDVIIIGGGPAGLTAAAYLGRKALNALIITKNIGGQALLSIGIENYMGYQFVAGQELMNKFEEQVRQYNVKTVYSEVIKVYKESDRFVALAADTERFYGKTVIIATGKRSRTLNAKGIDSYVGRGISYCATCDGPLFVGVDVAVIGGGNSAITIGIELQNIARKVYMINRSSWRADEIYTEKLKDAPNIEVLIGYELVEVIGNDVVNAAVIQKISDHSLRTVPLSGIFIEIGLMPNSDLVKDFVALNQDREIIVGCDCSTNVPGIYGAGDVTSVPEKQIIVAAGEGAKAAISAYKCLLKGGGQVVTGY